MASLSEHRERLEVKLKLNNRTRLCVFLLYKAFLSLVLYRSGSKGTDCLGAREQIIGGTDEEGQLQEKSLGFQAGQPVTF